MGVCPTQLKAARVLAAKATGVEGHCLCPTAVIQLALGKPVGPTIAVPVDMVLQWLTILQAYRKRFEKAWGKAHSLRLHTKKWANVKGPISGCVMTLLQLSWECAQPHYWTAPTGACFELMERLEADKHACAELTKDIYAPVDDKEIWEHSATHHNGLGGVQPPGITDCAKHIKKLNKQGIDPQASMILETQQRAVVGPTCVVVRSVTIARCVDNLRRTTAISSTSARRSSWSSRGRQ